MPDNAPDNSALTTPEDATTTSAPSGEVPPSSATGTPSPPAAAQDTGFKFAPGAGVPDWAVGKTAQEVAAIAGQLHTALRTGQPAPATTQPAAPAPMAPAPAPTTPAMPTQDDWLNDPVKAAQRQLATFQETQLQPMVNQYAATIGEQARAIVQMQDPDAFKRWAPEIDVMISQVDPQFRTVDNLKKLVGIVKSEHLDELTEERVQAKIAQMQESGSLRSDSALPAGASANLGGRLDLDKAELPDAYRRVLARYNITPETLDEFLTSTEVASRGIPLQQARDEWLEKAKAGDIITEQPLRIG